MLGRNAEDHLLTRALALREKRQTQHIVIEKARIDETQYKLHFDRI